MMILKKLLIGMFVGFGFMVQGLFGLTISSNTTLSGTYNEDINITDGFVQISGDANITGTVYISGGTLSVHDYNTSTSDRLNIYGNLQQSGGNVQPAAGKLFVDGNCSITGDSYFNMTTPLGEVSVNGDFTMASNYSHDIRLREGVLTVKGNFTQSTVIDDDNFYSAEEHKVVLSGNTEQHVHFDSPLSSTFNTLEINNTSAEGVDLGEIKIFGELITTTSNIHNLSLHGQNTRWTNDVTIDDSIRLKSGSLHFDNNQTVTIDGDVIIESLILNLKNSTFLVSGDLNQTGSYLASGSATMVVDGNYTLTGNSKLEMVETDANITVNGNFTMASNVSTSNTLNYGTLSVKGDFRQSTTGASDNFYANNGHKVVLSGNTAQNVHFDSPTVSQFSVLEINNTSVQGVDLGEIRINANLITTTSNIHNLNLIAYDLTLENNITIDGGMILKSGNLFFDSHTVTVHDDFTVEGTTLDLDTSTFILHGDLFLSGGSLLADEGTMLIDGNVLHSDGTLYADAGTVVIDGNYTVTDGSIFKMEDPLGNVTVNGDFAIGSNVGSINLFTDGTLTLKGDFNQSGHSQSFFARENHKVILSGDTQQQISFTSSPSSGFGDLTISNISAEGVTFQTATDVKDILSATNCQTRLNLDNVTYGTLVLDNSCTPLSLLVSDTTSYFASETGLIGERTYNSDGSYTGSITLADGRILDVAGTYSSEGDVLTLNRTSPATAETIATYLGEDAGVTSFSVSFNGGTEFISNGYTTAQERDDAVAHAVLLTIVDTTRYYINTKGAIGERTYNGDGTYTGSIIFANGNTLPVITGTYEIIDDQVIIDRSTPTEDLIELTYLSTDAGVIHFDVLFRGEVFQSSSYTTKEERDAAIPNDGINPALIMYLLN